MKIDISKIDFKTYCKILRLEYLPVESVEVNIKIAEKDSKFRDEFIKKSIFSGSTVFYNETIDLIKEKTGVEYNGTKNLNL